MLMMDVFTMIYYIKQLIARMTSFFIRFVLSFSKKYRVGSGVRFRGLPDIYVRKGSVMIIENNVVINSLNSGYHINMHSPCKFLVDGNDAVLKIGSNSRIHGSCIHASRYVSIGKRCLIAANTHIIDSNGHELLFASPEKRIYSTDKPKPIHIGDDVWIGANTIILPGTFIGSGCVVSANSVVKGKYSENLLIK